MKNLFFFILFSTTFTIGVNAMSFLNSDTVLNWEWPANRLIKHKIVIELLDVVAVKKRIKSPSFAADLPDPMVIQGKILRGDFVGQSEMIKLILPKVELGDVSKGSKLALGMIDEKTVVCITILPLNLKEIEEKTWLEQWQCK